MKNRRPFAVWVATISLSLVFAFQTATLAAVLILPNWSVQPIQTLLMVPTAVGLLALAFPRKWSREIATLALGVLLVWFVMAAIAFGLWKSLRNLEFIWAFVALWAWLFYAFACGEATRIFFADLRDRSEDA